jgi:hypothetical protein
MAPGKTVHNGENRRKMDALTIRYYDSLAADLDAGVEISPRGYVYFLCHLTDLSAEVSDQIKDVKAYLDKEQGFTLSDGLWWYRKAGPDAAKGEWTVLTSGAVYDQMLVEVEKKTEWIEVQHVSFHLCTLLLLFYKANQSVFPSCIANNETEMPVWRTRRRRPRWMRRRSLPLSLLSVPPLLPSLLLLLPPPPLAPPPKSPPLPSGSGTSGRHSSWTAP